MKASSYSKMPVAKLAIKKKPAGRVAIKKKPAAKMAIKKKPAARVAIKKKPAAKVAPKNRPARAPTVESALLPMWLVAQEVTGTVTGILIETNPELGQYLVLDISGGSLNFWLADDVVMPELPPSPDPTAVAVWQIDVLWENDVEAHDDGSITGGRFKEWITPAQLLSIQRRTAS